MISPIANVKLPTSGILSFGFVRSDTHIHRGIDIPAKLGTPVRAAASGVVEHAYSSLAPGFSGYGVVAVVRSGPNGPWQLYAHMDKVLVKKGQTVLEGQQIGTVGRSCFNKEDPKHLCDGPHLHFEVSPRPYPQDSEAPRMDPVAWIQGGSAGLGFLVLVGLGGWWWMKRKHKALGDYLPGGRASGMRPSAFDPVQLRRGTKHEMEHTNNRDVAREIAMDHLAEDPDYYTKLERAGL